MSHVLPHYRDLLRPEILALIPKETKILLDIGCGTGQLGAAIKRRQITQVIGIEQHKPSARIANKILDRVYNTNAQTWNPEILEIKPDCLVLADILEHLPNPWHALTKLSNALADNATIIASIPLIDNPNIIYNLQRGLFIYRKAGITDITHLRFFTQSTITQMFTNANLKILTLYRFPSCQNPQQLIITATKLKKQNPQTETTILIVTHNALDYTKQALNSLNAHTNDPHKTIVIDNNSKDGTQYYLHEQPNLLTIEHTHNLGFPAAINTALPSINTKYFVIINNDVLLTPNWLTQLTTLMHDNPTIGILGATTQNISGPQQITPPPYDNNDQLNYTALKLQQQNENHIQHHPRIVFVLAILRTELLAKIGPLDERFGLGNFEDDDYCLRAILAGYQASFTKSVFVHHYGSTSFKENNIDYKRLIIKNAKLFASKWGNELFFNRHKIYDTKKPNLAK